MGGDGEYHVGWEGERSRVLSGCLGGEERERGVAKMAVEKGNAVVPTQQRPEKGGGSE